MTALISISDSGGGELSSWKEIFALYNPSQLSGLRSSGEFLPEALNFVPELRRVGLQNIRYVSDAKAGAHGRQVIPLLAICVGGRQVHIGQSTTRIVGCVSHTAFEQRRWTRRNRKTTT